MGRRKDNAPVGLIVRHSEGEPIGRNLTEVEDINACVSACCRDVSPQQRGTFADIVPDGDDVRTEPCRKGTRDVEKICRFKVNAEKSANIRRSEDVKIQGEPPL